MPSPLRSFVREPVVHFALGAALLFGAERVASRRARTTVDARPRVVLTEGVIEAIRARFAAGTGRVASDDDLRSLIREHVRDEALSREASARGLERADPVVRRRLVQKMEFVIEAGVEVPEPDDAALAQWLSQNAERYRTPARVSFEQVFFAREGRVDAALDARRALALMAPDEPVAAATTRGDPFPRGMDFPAMRFADVTAAFGYDFARALDAMSPGAWSSPVESAHGWHLVRVRVRDPGGVPPLEAVRDDVRRRWRDARREAMVREATQHIVDRYEVVMPRGGR